MEGRFPKTIENFRLEIRKFSTILLSLYSPFERRPFFTVSSRVSR